MSNYSLIILSDFSKETRSAYLKQHSRIADNSVAMSRFLKSFNTEYLGLDKDYFRNKKFLDAGCGNTGQLFINCHNMGCTDMTGLDLGVEFIEETKKVLKKYNIPLENIQLDSGSVVNLPYDDNTFDFTSCNGVMLHLNNTDESEKAFAELVRVTKPGGLLYTVYGTVGGIYEGAINLWIRDYYRNNAEFKNIIDNISPKTFSELLSFISSEIEKHAGEKIDLSSFESLFDVDLCVTIQNVIQAPIRLTQELNQEWVEKQCVKNMCEDLKRLQRYVKRENVRKFLAPFHFNKEHWVSRLLYGEGNLEFICRKKTVS